MASVLTRTEPYTYTRNRMPEEVRSSSLQHLIDIESVAAILSSYLFNLYYVKGKDVIRIDVFSRINNGESDPPEIIPMSFTMQKVVISRYYNIQEKEKEKYNTIYIYICES